MQPATKRKFVFITRSVFWSMLLYVAVMLIFNWEEVSNKVNGKNSVTVVTHTLPQPAEVIIPATTTDDVAKTTDIISGLWHLVKQLTGRASAATSF